MFGLKEEFREVDGDSTGLRRARVLKRSDGKAQAAIARPLLPRSFPWRISFFMGVLVTALWYGFALSVEDSSYALMDFLVLS